MVYDVPFKVDENLEGKVKSAPETKNPNEKGKDHCIAKALEIYCNHINGRTGVAIGRQDRYSYLRHYGEGDQDMSTYVKYFFREAGSGSTVPAVDAGGVDQYKGVSKESNAKGFMNVMWEVISLAPKIVDAIVGNFEKGEYDISADPLDASSKTIKEDKKALLWYQSKNKDFERDIQENGLGIPCQEPDYMPETKEELDLYEEEGGFKEGYAMVMELLIKHHFDISDWGEIRKQIITDAINLNLFAVRDYYCHRDNKLKTEYVDPRTMVIQNDSSPYFQKSEYAGHFEDVSIGELREQGFEDEDLKKAAKAFSGYAGNPGEDEWNTYDKPYSYGNGASFDFYKVCVFHCEWVEVDGKQDMIRKNSFGKTRVIPQDYGTENKDNEKSSTRITDRRMKYQCSWIVGTDMAYDWGKCYDITRPITNLREVNLSYHVYRLNGTKSITERLIPIYDNFMILWVKFQNAIAQARNAGYAIDYDQISTLSIGGEKYSEKLILKRFLETGILIFKRTKIGGGPKATSGTPVYELKSNIADAFVQFREGFNMNISMMETLTGFIPLTIGGSPDPSNPVGTSTMAVEATANTLRPLMSAYMHTKKEVAENITLWIQILVKSNKITETAYREVIGEEKIKLLKDADANGAYYGINLIPRPTDAEKAQIYEKADTSLANGRDGKPGINMADFFRIMHILTTGGSLKLAEMILRNSIDRSQRERDAVAQQNIQAQNDGAMQAKQLDIQGQMTIIQTTKDLELRNKVEEHKMKLVEIREQAALKPEPAIQ